MLGAGGKTPSMGYIESADATFNAKTSSAFVRKLFLFFVAEGRFEEGSSSLSHPTLLRLVCRRP